MLQVQHQKNRLYSHIHIYHTTNSIYISPKIRIPQDKQTYIQVNNQLRGYVHITCTTKDDIGIAHPTLIITKRIDSTSPSKQKPLHHLGYQHYQTYDINTTQDILRHNNKANHPVVFISLSVTYLVRRRGVVVDTL